MSGHLANCLEGTPVAILIRRTMQEQRIVQNRLVRLVLYEVC